MLPRSVSYLLPKTPRFKNYSRSITSYLQYF